MNNQQQLHVLHFRLNAEFIQENAHGAFSANPQSLSYVGDLLNLFNFVFGHFLPKGPLGSIGLVLDVPEPEGSVDNHEDDGKDDSREKHKDTAEHVDEEIAHAKCGQHHQGWMILLHGLELYLSICEVIEGPKQDGHGEDAKEHLSRMQEADHEKDEEC